MRRTPRYTCLRDTGPALPKPLARLPAHALTCASSLTRVSWLRALRLRKDETRLAPSGIGWELKLTFLCWLCSGDLRSKIPAAPSESGPRGGESELLLRRSLRSGADAQNDEQPHRRPFTAFSVPALHTGAEGA